MTDTFCGCLTHLAVGEQDLFAMLAKNQRGLMHVVKESITVLNTSRVQISENRQKINDILSTMMNLNKQLKMVSETTAKEIVSLESLVETYMRISLMRENRGSNSV